MSHPLGKYVFKMFPKQAIARLLYKLGRMEGSLDAMQEEEQNGFRQGKQGEQGERASLHCHVNVCLKKNPRRRCTILDHQRGSFQN